MKALTNSAQWRRARSRRRQNPWSSGSSCRRRCWETMQKKQMTTRNGDRLFYLERGSEHQSIGDSGKSYACAIAAYSESPKIDHQLTKETFESIQASSVPRFIPVGKRESDQSARWQPSREYEKCPSTEFAMLREVRFTMEPAVGFEPTTC